MPVNKYTLPATSIGGSLISKMRWAGPASYTQVTTGAPPTGGDLVTNSAFGIPVITQLFGGITTDGSFRVDAIVLQGQTSAILFWTALKTATIGGQSQTVGTQAAASTNLSTFLVDLTALQYVL